MTAPLPDAVVRILEQDPYVEKTVDQFLRDAGLPPLPHPPVHHGHGGAPPDGQQQPDGQQPVVPQLPVVSPTAAPAPTLAPSPTSASAGQPITVPDIAGLVQPLTALAGLLGTGNSSGGAGSGDGGSGSGSGSGSSGSGSSPTQLLSQISSGLGQAMQLGTTAMAAVASAWQGSGQQAAQQKSTQAQQNNQQLNTQGQQQQSIIQQAGQTVAVGTQQITGVVTALVAQLTGLAPMAPLSIPAMVAAATAALEQGVQIVTTTEGQLTQQAGQMVQAGLPVPITSPPNVAELAAAASVIGAVGSAAGSVASSLLGGLGSAASSATEAGTEAASTGANAVSQLTQELPQIAQPLAQMAQQAITTVAGPNGLGALKPQLVNALAPIGTAPTAPGAPAGASGGAGVGGGGVGGDGEGGVDAEGGAGVPENAAPPLTPLTDAKVAEADISAAEAELMERPMAGVAEGAGAPFMPMGGAGAAMAAGAAGSNSTHKQSTVSADYGDEMVGEIEPGTYPVVGEIDEVAPPVDKDQAFKIF